MPTPLRVAFLGGSERSAVGRAHLSAIRMDGLYELVAGCFSTDRRTNASTAEAYGVPLERVYRHWRALITAEASKIDAVIVLTPTPAHAEMVIAGLEAGVPVICEKALAASRADIARIQEVERRTGGFLAVTYTYSGYPMLREMARLVRAGALGRVQQIHAHMPQEGYLRTDATGRLMRPQAWRLCDGAAPMLHLDLGVHLHQLVDYVTGLKPVEVTALADRFGAFDEVIDNVTALVRYEAGAVGNVWFSKSALGWRNGLTISVYGSKGSASWVQANPEELTLGWVDGRREIRDRAGEADTAAAFATSRFKPGHPAGFIEAFANLYRDIAAALVQHKAEGVWASDEVFGAALAYDGLCFLEAMTQSAAEKRTIALSAPGEAHEAAA